MWILKKNSDSTSLGVKGTSEGSAVGNKFMFHIFPTPLSRSLAHRVVLLCLVFLLCKTSIKCPVFKQGLSLKGEYECYTSAMCQKLISRVRRCPWVMWHSITKGWPNAIGLGHEASSMPLHSRQLGNIYWKISPAWASVETLGMTLILITCNGLIVS